MNFFKSILSFFKNMFSSFYKERGSGDVEKAETNTGESKLNNINIKLKEIAKNEKNGSIDVSELLQEKTAIEISGNNPNNFSVPDRSEIEQEVLGFNHRLFELDKEKNRIEKTTTFDTSKIDYDIANLEKILREGLEKETTFYHPSKVPRVEIDDFFSRINIVKLYKRREKRRKKEEKRKTQYVQNLIGEFGKLIHLNKLDEALKLTSKVEISLRNLNKAGEKRSLEDQFFSLQEILDNKVKIRRKKELEKRRRQEEARRRAQEEKKRQKEERLKQLEKEKKREEEQKKEQLQALLTYKSNWKEFEKVLKDKAIIELYHFTDIANIESIKKAGGLYSWYYCRRTGIDVPVPGGDGLSKDLDRRKGLQDYVRLSFISDHPMMFVALRDKRIFNPAILKISTEVVFFEHTRFSDMNAVDSRSTNGRSVDYLKGLKFNIFSQSYFNLDGMEKKYYQAEVLVKTWVPKKYILNLDQF